MRIASLFALAALATALALHGDRGAAQPAAQTAPVDGYHIRPDVRVWTAAEDARDTALHRRARAAYKRGDFDQADGPWREALALREATWGVNHPVTAYALQNLAGNLVAQGRLSDAEPLLRRVQAIQESRLGAAHLDTALALSNLAMNLDLRGRYSEAEPLFRRALAIREARLGADHPDTARSLSGVALNLQAQGRLAEAEPLFRRALSTFEERSEVDVAAGLSNLALNLQAQRRFVDAEPLLRRALALREVRLGNDHPDTAQIIDNLAISLQAQRRFADAEPLFRRTLAIREMRLGADHPDTARALNNLATNYAKDGRFVQAEPLFRRSRAIFEACLGVDHPSTAESAKNVALAALAAGGSALADARAAYRARRSFEAAISASSAEETRASLLSDARVASVVLMRTAWVARRGDVALRAEAFDAAQTIGVSGVSRAMLHGAARLAAERAGAGEAVAAWLNASVRVATLDASIAAAAAQGAAADIRRAELSRARSGEVAALEREQRSLAARFPRYFDVLKTPPISLASLQAQSGNDAKLLRGDEALVLLTAGDRRMPEGHRRGLVFVVTKETSAWAEIPLEPNALAAEIAALHAMLAAPGAGATLTAGAVAPSVTYDRARAFALYRALFGAPDIAAALVGKDRWLIAPQGALMSLPFAALPMATPSGAAAGDADPAALRATAWLGVERTLAILPSVSALRVQRLYPLTRAQAVRTPFFGLGDPAFRGVVDAEVRGGGQLAAARNYFRGGVADLTAFSRLPRLPNTAREIRALATNLGAGADAYVLQLDANEAELRRRGADGRLARAEVVAFATHGLLAGELDIAVAEPSLALTPPALAAGVTPSAENDGLLTASEAATLSLSARFVILSACNTAAGGKPDADALSGLARAFLYAGAQSLLVSHYPVYDDAAMRLTTEAVRRARSHNLHNPEAMRASMKALLQDASADERGRSFAHPTAWAPFVVIDAN